MPNIKPYPNAYTAGGYFKADTTFGPIFREDEGVERATPIRRGTAYIASLEADYTTVMAGVGRIAVALTHLEADETVTDEAISLLEKQQEQMREVAHTLLARLDLAVREHRHG